MNFFLGLDLKFTILNTRFQSARHLLIKVKILQDFNVAPFCPHKWCLNPAIKIPREDTSDVILVPKIVRQFLLLETAGSLIKAKKNSLRRHKFPCKEIWSVICALVMKRL